MADAPRSMYHPHAPRMCVPTAPAAWVCRPHRTTQKPELADPYLEELVKTLFTQSTSLVQIIGHSDVWGHKFGTYVKALEEDEKIGHEIRNVSAAKHRHESGAKPRGRFVLNMDAFIEVALHIIVDRDGDQRKHAEAFLTFLTEEVALQAAMLADATDEGLFFTRQLDSEELDSAEVQLMAETFVARIRYLFIDRGCLCVPGYTTFMLKSLERPRTFQPTRTAGPRTLGGSSWPQSAVVDRCIARMQKYARLTIAVTAAEFPSFELCSNFRVFHLEGVRKHADAHARLAGDAHARPVADGADSETDRNLAKLSAFFGVDELALKHQFRELRPIAQQHKATTQCDNATAWRHAVKSCSTRHRKLDNNPSKALITVLMRYICFSLSTAGVEQNFSIFKRAFGDQALNASEDHEQQMIKIILTKPTESEKVSILKRAQARHDWCRFVSAAPRLHVLVPCYQPFKRRSMSPACARRSSPRRSRSTAAAT